MMSHQVLVASESAFRRAWCVDELVLNGMDVTTATDGVDCIAKMRDVRPDVVLLELSLLWGGSQGVLAIRAEEHALQSIPVVLLAVDGFAAEWYQSAQYSIQGFLLRRPSSELLVSALLAAMRRADRETREISSSVQGPSRTTLF
ncbi:ANTAR domain-containing protein [Schlesneria paludicola]|uniref:response regulator transcription factor n=1 Tax=Schlesneria paludicola TaxID=360056 RepID=UPI0002E64570|nr:response regulator transcription factor [Schlesneria paludicola]